MRTYSLSEVAEILCGDDLQNPELWVTRRIKSGQFRALKVGRSYRMTEEQLAEALASLEVRRPSVQVNATKLTPTALRRRRAS